MGLEDTFSDVIMSGITIPHNLHEQRFFLEENQYRSNSSNNKHGWCLDEAFITLINITVSSWE